MIEAKNLCNSKHFNGMPTEDRPDTERLPEILFDGALQAGPARINATIEQALTQRLTLLDQNGYRAIPTRGKTPSSKDWRNTTFLPSAWKNGSGTGILCGHNELVALDIDTDDPGILSLIERAMPNGCPRKRGRKGITYFVRAKVKEKASFPVGFSSIDGEWKVQNVEVLTSGQQTVIPPSIHPETQQPYVWLASADGIVRTLYDTPASELPKFDGDLVAALEKVLKGSIIPKQLVKACKEVANATNGDRNDTFNKQVFGLGTGKAPIDPVMAKRCLTLAAQHSGLEEAEIEATFQSAFDAATAKLPQGKSPEADQLQVPGIPTPWHEPVNGAELLDEIVAIISKHLVLPPRVAELLAVWAIATYGADRATEFVRLIITSIDAQCGKSKVLDVLAAISCKPMRTDDISAAAIYRVVDAVSPTLLLDEADVWLDEHYRGLLNSGHKKGGNVVRCDGDDYTPRRFNTYAPTAIARIGQFPNKFGPLMSRSISIRMSRSTAEEFKKLEPITEQTFAACDVIARKAQRWMQDAELNPRPVLPDFLSLRTADNWRFLFAVAQAAGGSWPDRIIEIASVLYKPSSDSSNANRRGLMSAIKTILDEPMMRKADRIRTKKLCDLLGEMEGFRDAYKFQKKSDREAGWLLKNEFKDFAEIPAPKKMRFGDNTFQGYPTQCFRDVFERYGVKGLEDEDDEAPEAPA